MEIIGTVIHVSESKAIQLLDVQLRNRFITVTFSISSTELELKGLEAELTIHEEDDFHLVSFYDEDRCIHSFDILPALKDEDSYCR